MSSGIPYALVIGVENYVDSKPFKRVRNAAKDATDFATALQGLGVEKENINLLIDGQATKTRIEKAISDIIRDVTEIDRIIFYFSGHGAYEGGGNYLLPVDCVNDALPKTSVSINNILNAFKNCSSTRNLIFLDCCHSGLEPGVEEKSLQRDFLVDNLYYNVRDEEYTIIFASCKSHQTSFTHPKLPNSVWTHFLLQALTGNTTEIYETGLLYHDKLQSYLNKETDNFIKLNTDHGKKQTPILFGKVSDRFIIGNLNPILEAQIQAATSKAISLTNISILSIDSGSIKELPGFKKGFGGHKIPQKIDSYTAAFVRKIGQPIIADEISMLSKEIQSKLKYKLRQFKAHSDDGSGTISTPDFTYSMDIVQSDTEPGQFLLIRKLENIQNSNIVLNEEFNKIFASHFERLEFSFDSDLDLEEFISQLEEKELDNITLEYDGSNLTECILKFEGLTSQIVITTSTLVLSNYYKSSPADLVQNYIDTRKHILEYPELKLIH